jgi:hypothetical protein
MLEERLQSVARLRGEKMAQRRRELSISRKTGYVRLSRCCYC